MRCIQSGGTGAHAAVQRESSGELGAGGEWSRGEESRVE